MNFGLGFGGMGHGGPRVEGMLHSWRDPAGGRNEFEVLVGWGWKQQSEDGSL